MKNELLGCFFLAVAKKLGVAANTCCSVVKSDRPSTQMCEWNEEMLWWKWVVFGNPEMK